MLAPLFQASHRYAEGATDNRRCVLCDQRGVCLPLDDVMVPCAACGAQTRIRTRRRSDACHHCGAPVTLPAAAGLPLPLRGCVPCLRAGRWTQSHVTETGVIDAELLRTPRYATFQGERWLFCHDLPMVYLGEWTRPDFETARPGAGYDLFTEIVRDLDPATTADAWEHGLTPHGGEPDLRVYAFRCQHCAGLRTHSDCD